jgi:hypothetical protein
MELNVPFPVNVPFPASIVIAAQACAVSGRRMHCNALQDEYGVDITLEPLSFSVARWVLGGWPAVERAGRMFNTTVVKDAFGRPVLLFRCVCTCVPAVVYMRGCASVCLHVCLHAPLCIVTVIERERYKELGRDCRLHDVCGARAAAVPQMQILGFLTEHSLCLYC